MIKNGIKFKLIKDQLGSIRLVVNTINGNIKSSVEYDEFGRIEQETKLKPNMAAFGFAGGIRDPGTGLVRFGARDYDPQIGRWTAKDPIGFNGGDSNLYGYTWADPINFIDPTGHQGERRRVRDPNGGSTGVDLADFFNAWIYDTNGKYDRERNEMYNRNADIEFKRINIIRSVKTVSKIIAPYENQRTKFIIDNIRKIISPQECR